MDDKQQAKKVSNILQVMKREKIADVEETGHAARWYLKGCFLTKVSSIENKYSIVKWKSIPDFHLVSNNTKNVWRESGMDFLFQRRLVVFDWSFCMLE